jgi:tetratricopeptide (TPR) repeat protein
MAAEYTVEQPHLRRSDRITILIRDAAEEIDNEGHRQRVILVFGIYDSGHESATKLRGDANRELNEQHLSESARVLRDRRAFRSLEASMRRVLVRRKAQLEEIEDAGVAYNNVSILPDTLSARFRTSPARTRRKAASAPGIGEEAPGDVRPTSEAPFMVPQDVHHFVGRRRELAELYRTVARRTPVVIHGVFGMAGVGKTSLAIRFAHEYREQFSDGVLWAQLDKSSAQEIMYAFAQTFDRGAELIALPTVELRVAFLQSLLSDRNILTILDNAITSEQTEPLIRALSACPVIVTSRHRDLSILINAVVLDIEPLSPDEALAMLRRVLGSDTVDNEHEEASELCELLGYLPLAIRIIAERARISGISLGTLLRQYRKRQSVDQLRYGTDLRKDADVRRSFDLSYNELPRTDQTIFADLGVFGGTDFGSDAVAHVIELDPTQAASYLEAFAGLSLVQPSVPGRWRLHPLLREYAKEHIDDQGSYDRMVAFFVDFSNRAGREFRGPAQNIWLHRVDSEVSNIRAAIETANRNGLKEEAATMLSSLMWFWSTRGYHREVRRWLRLALEDRALLSSSVRASLLLTAGVLESNQGNFEEARQHVEECVALRRESADTHELAEALHRLAYVCWGQGQYGDARGYAEQAYQLYEHLGDAAGRSTSLNMRGLITAYELEFAASADLFRKSVEQWRGLSDEWGLATALNNLGEVLRCLGDLPGAESCYSEALNLRVELDDKWSTANSMNNLAELMRAQGKTTLAQEYYEHGLRLCRQFDNAVGLANSLAGLAGLATVRQHWVRSAHLFGATERLLSRCGARLGPANLFEYEAYRQRTKDALGGRFERELHGWDDLDVEDVLHIVLGE